MTKTGSDAVNEAAFLRQARLWRRLGIGYSAPEVTRMEPEADESNATDPEKTLLDTLPYLLYDGHQFGLVLGCLGRFADLWQPSRLLDLFPAKFPESYERPFGVLSPEAQEALATSYEFSGLRAVVTLLAISVKMARRNEEWKKVESYTRARLPAWLAGDLRDGRLRLWNAEREREVRGLLRMSSGDEDLELAMAGVRFPSVDLAPGKKLRERSVTIEENAVYKERQGLQAGRS